MDFLNLSKKNAQKRNTTFTEKNNSHNHLHVIWIEKHILKSGVKTLLTKNNKTYYYQDESFLIILLNNNNNIAFPCVYRLFSFETL